MWLFDQKGGFPVPTQEERLSAFEQTLTALSRDIKDINHNETMLLGMSMKQGEDIREIRSNLASLGERLDTFGERLNTSDQSVNSRFEAQDKKLDQVLLLLNTFTAKPGQETE